MAYLVRQTVDLYRKFVVDSADPRTKDYWVCNPLTPVFISSVYLLFVTDIGPSFMKSRKPYNLKNVILLYNAMQIFANAYIFLTAFPVFLNISYTCAEITTDYTEANKTIVYVGTLYVYTKLLDLLDTVFFILRKKDSQISFLHVYHHGVMIFIGFISLRYFPGGHTGFQLFFNTFVHIPMYIYYFLTCLDEKYKKKAWWKKYLTQMQMMQFIICFGLYMGPIIRKDCGYSKKFALLALSQNLIMFLMFANFYYRAYVAKKNK